MSKTISVRLSEKLAAKLDRLAALSGRSPEWMIRRMIEEYIDDEIRVSKEIREAVDEYQAGESEWIPHEVVMREMDELLRAKLGDTEFERLMEEDRKRQAKDKQRRRAHLAPR